MSDETRSSSDDSNKSGGEMDDGMDSVINEFLVESYDNLDRLDLDFIELEKNPRETTLLASIFRTIHTIKGTCGFLGFSKLESIAHVGENLLSRLRDGELLLNEDHTNALLSMVDAIRQILSSIENDRNEGDVDYSELVEILTRLNKGESLSGATPTVTKEESVDSASAAPVETPEPVAQESEPPIEAISKETEEAPVVKATQDDALKSEGSDKPAAARSAGVADTSIRVDVNLLDTLMNLVGELVLARNQIMQFSPGQRDAKFAASSQTLNLITTELQEGVMKTRMQPIGNIWDKFPRVVRDLSLACGKKVRLEMEGKDTELDKTLIEAIKDPLTHIVRNAVDHGIEMPDVRAKAGKPEEGRLFLHAFHEGGQVNIVISDDGGGIDPEKVKAKALSKNVITEAQAKRMSDRELVNLIFAPGFSTAAKVTNVSGRGVGMDVVKTNIEKIGGTVDVQGTVGEGTSLKVKIPLTLAIIPALIVTCGGNRFAIPQVSLLELVLLEGEDALNGVEKIQGTPVYRLRGNLLPLVYLSNELKVKSMAPDSCVNIVVLHADDRQFGLVVDGIHDTEEIVVKPLSKQLKGITAFAGATIMGDGKVALILDVMGLAQKASVLVEGRERKLAEDKEKTAVTEGDRQTLLIFRLGKADRMAIPLSQVARLEEFRMSDVEKSGDQSVVQYRGEIMPLAFLSKLLEVPMNGSAEVEKETMQAVVFTHKGKSMGLVVENIIDIIEETVTMKRDTRRKGIMGTVVVQERVTDMLDLKEVIELVEPSFFEVKGTTKELVAKE